MELSVIEFSCESEITLSPLLLRKDMWGAKLKTTTPDRIVIITSYPTENGPPKVADVIRVSASH
jgi:hypothetical protein